jgi:hypothetical protein
MNRRDFAKTVGALPVVQVAPAQQAPVSIGSRRELLIDRELIADARGVELRLATPVDAGPAMHFDKPWEGAFCGYTTILQEKDRFRMYYRGVPVAGQDGTVGEVTCVAESQDGINWTRPDLGIYDVRGTRKNNVILANDPPYSHNFTPLIDTRPGVGPSMKYRALAGVHKTGLVAFVSADGLRWKRLQEQPVLPPPKEFSLDSQNIAFWSEPEKKYVLYYRTWKKIGSTGYRWVSRAASEDFVNWTSEGEMSYGDAPPEHLYTNQTSMYFRAPHIYTGICARFMPGRQVLREEQARELNVDPKYFKDCSDAVLVTSRGSTRYTRTFMDAFLRPGIGLENWVSRSNYPALHLVQTSTTKMSFYVNRNYGQPTAYLRRYELRLDGLASAHAGYSAGEFVTKPLVFDGSRLELNYSTSAAGSVRVELQDGSGTPLPGFALSDSTDVIGDQIERDCAWKNSVDVSSLKGKPVRVRFVLKDADLYAFRFRT